MRLALLLSLAVGACAPQAPATEPSTPVRYQKPTAASDAPLAEVSVIREADGTALLGVVFREAVPVQAGRPANIEMGDGTLVAEHVAGPELASGPLTQFSLSYRLGRDDARRMAQGASTATIALYDGSDWRSYPFVRSDVITN